MSFEPKVLRDGSLARAAPLFIEIDTAAELANVAYVEPGLRNRWFYVANFAMYTIENGIAFLYFGGRDANPILDDLGSACDSLIADGKYAPSAEQRARIDESARSGRCLRTPLADLDLDRDGHRRAFLEVDATDLERLGEPERRLAELAFGEGRQLVYNMQLFADMRLYTTRIYLLSPEAVAATLDEGDADARPCWFYTFDNYCKLDAVDTNVRNVGSIHGILAGPNA